MRYARRAAHCHGRVVTALESRTMIAKRQLVSSANPQLAWRNVTTDDCACDAINHDHSEPPTVTPPTKTPDRYPGRAFDVIVSAQRVRADYLPGVLLMSIDDGAGAIAGVSAVGATTLP